MRLVFLTAVVIFFSSCSPLFPNLSPPKPPETLYTYEQTFTKNPTAVVTGNQIAVVEAQEQRVSINLTKREKELNSWQRFCNWLGKLGMIGMIALIAAFIFFPGGTMMFLFTRYQKIRKALKQTVDGIKESKAVEKDVVLKEALSSKQDQDTKKLIDDLRRA